MTGPRSKELKVRLPLEQHVALHTLKVLHGQPIQSTVEAALAAYFRALEEGEAVVAPPNKIGPGGSRSP